MLGALCRRFHGYHMPSEVQNNNPAAPRKGRLLIEHALTGSPNRRNALVHSYLFLTSSPATLSSATSSPALPSPARHYAAISVSVNTPILVFGEVLILHALDTPWRAARLGRWASGRLLLKLSGGEWNGTDTGGIIGCDPRACYPRPKSLRPLLQ